MTGRTVKHYEVLEKLGEGGMGTVYRAHDTTLKRDVALKFLGNQAVNNDSAVERFVREAQAAAAMADHPNICHVYEIDRTDEGQPFIVMTLYSGQSLHDELEARRIQPAEAVEIAIGVCTGLAQAHSQGIVHRDIKPANILLTANQGVKILDFGVARLIDRTSLTDEGSQPGTVAYMSPEQANGERIDPRSDLFSLGITLYETLAGRRPFDADHPHAVLYQIINEPHEPISKLVPGIPGALDRVIDGALAKEVAERFRSAEEMREGLIRSLAASDPERVLKYDNVPPPRPNPLSRLLVPLLIVAVAATAIVLLWQRFG